MPSAVCVTAAVPSAAGSAAIFCAIWRSGSVGLTSAKRAAARQKMSNLPIIVFRAMSSDSTAVDRGPGIKCSDSPTSPSEVVSDIRRRISNISATCAARFSEAGAALGFCRQSSREAWSSSPLKTYAAGKFHLRFTHIQVGQNYREKDKKNERESKSMHT
jgi:hypothetical protein